MDDFLKWLSNILIKYSPALLFGITGGIVRILKREELPTLKKIGIEAFIAGFIGVCVYILLLEANVKEGYSIVSSGFAGLACRELMIFFESMFTKFIKSKLGGDKQ